jgi:SRSO17 transposase
MISFDITKIQPIKVDVTSVSDDHPKYLNKGHEVSASVRTKRFQMEVTCQIFKPELSTDEIEKEVRKAFIEDMQDLKDYKP